MHVTIEFNEAAFRHGVSKEDIRHAFQNYRYDGPMEEKGMPRLTEEEAWALEEEVTRNPPKVDPAKARHPVRMVSVDDLSADWLRIKASAEHTTPEAIIGELVREKIAAASA